MHGSSRVLLLVVACCLFALAASVPEPGKKGHRFGFKGRSAKLELGEQKLNRITARSKSGDITVDQLALQLETDDDLVRMNICNENDRFSGRPACILQIGVTTGDSPAVPSCLSCSINCN